MTVPRMHRGRVDFPLAETGPVMRGQGELRLGWQVEVPADIQVGWSDRCLELALWGQTKDLAEEARVRHSKPADGGHPSICLNRTLALTSGTVIRPHLREPQALLVRGRGEDALWLCPTQPSTPSVIPSSALSSPGHSPVPFLTSLCPTAQQCPP